MMAIQLNRIGLPYPLWKSRARARQAAEVGKKLGLNSPSRLSDHLLRDIGALDGQDSRRRPDEPACSARDLIDRYR